MRPEATFYNPLPNPLNSFIYGGLYDFHRLFFFFPPLAGLVQNLL